MVGITYVHIDTVFGFYGYFFHPSLLLTWMSEHDCLDTYCFMCLICFVFLYLHLFTEHVSHGKVQLSRFHMESCSRNTLTIIIIIIIIVIVLLLLL